ncbi:MAG: hypothetical protein Q8S17_02130 [Humidesulfovibrio sp.]|nr:hypothetical protein [Humidesulfovibrio sp.]
MRKKTGLSLGRCAAVVLAVIALAALLCLGACGKREWPIPVSSQDKFRWRSVDIQRNQGCIILNCELSGNWENVDTVKVLLESVGEGPDDGCASCPFTPRRTIAFNSGDAAMRKDMNRIALTACGLDPGKTYRVQLIGFNAFARIAPVASELMLSAPK